MQQEEIDEIFEDMYLNQEIWDKIIQIEELEYLAPKRFERSRKFYKQQIKRKQFIRNKKAKINE